MRSYPLLLILNLLLLVSSLLSSHLYGIKTWKLVEAITSAYNNDFIHAAQIVSADNVRCEDLPYARRLLNMELEGCTPGKVNRNLHRWLNGNRRNGNRKVETLIEEFVMGDLLSNADTLYTNPLVVKLRLKTVLGYWDSWPAKEFFDKKADRLENFQRDLEAAEVGKHEDDLKLARETLLFKVELEVEESRKWYIRHVESVGEVAYYAGQLCAVDVNDEVIARGWVRKVKTLAEKVKSFEDFHNRAQGFYASHHISLMLETVESLRTTIQKIRKGFLSSCFWYSYTHNLKHNPPEALVSDLQTSITSSLLPTLSAFQHTLELSLTRLHMTFPSAPGLWNSSDGLAFYQFQIRKHTTLDMSPEEIHQLGLEEVGKVKREIREVVARIAATGDTLVSPTWSMQKILSTIRYAGEFFYDRSDEKGLIENVREILKMIEGKMDHAFSEDVIMQGKAELNVRIDPEGSMGYYVESTSPEENGTFYVGTAGLLSKLKMRALVCHEAIPGHHYQSSLLKAHPLFSWLYDANVEYSVSTEGWSLYAEKLCGEIGVMDTESSDLPARYSSHYHHLGRLSMQLIRAVRLVVDTGIHAKGWSREHVVNYFERNTDLSGDLVQAEIDRYLEIPGQALSYYMGLIELLKLREEVKGRSGKFDLKRFHREVLYAGSVPIPSLRKHVLSKY